MHSPGQLSGCLCPAVGQFILTPVLLHKGFVPCLLSNALYAAAFSYYHYLSFLGYSALPFLERTEVTPPLQAHLNNRGWQHAKKTRETCAGAVPNAFSDSKLVAASCCKALQGRLHKLRS